ncbi:MAG: nuclear transport factor 2 family protein [Sphingomonas sp.]|nr:nuclear transport factor 2 family protein [Sphingomonas sp.]
MLLITGLQADARPPAVAGHTAQAPAMSREKFQRYVALFNTQDPDFLLYYQPDVLFDKGTTGGLLKGRQAIIKWYADIWRDFAETITPLATAIDGNGRIMMVEMRVRLEARRNGVVWRGSTFAKGEALIVDGTIVYTLKDGLITTIRGAAEGRYRVRAGQENIP